ncbi:transmembrane protein 208 [Phlebotomus argentipes]|uniref:transmembrane protein 208 n=1 Tax=Phlebotomus argentipes TaxID=94469 RepID=UPI0028931765|nr:transmembrane protein 208 [Phlebotomus argentipes]
MAPPQKGKQATKGAKQIVEENAATLKFYRNMALIAQTAFLGVMLLLTDAFTGLTITMTIIAGALHFGSYQFMSFMARTQYSESGSLIDSGTDLNMEGGLSEHVKDLIILTSGTQLLALISNYFWLLLLLVPVRAFWLLWGSVIKPWMEQKNQEPEMDEKKQKKMEKRMKRMRQ